ncbi:lytic transglycosylase domain-containing protein [Christensenellaceae bacterium OttesenSCG-928-K19]|nr:lytic transglycosylase domain-containing protein [Christensenellaceae bacterium OttesenSCG-928-K19]
MSTAGSKKKKGIGVKVLVVILVIAIVAGGAIILVKNTRYPLEYEELIVQYSDEFGLDPYMVAAVIYTESGFDASAVSRSGAIGLMQIMPETGEWIAGKFDINNFKDNMLFDPQTNIRFGCWYLGFLEERFEGDNRLVWAAYNAGHNRVNQWLDDPAVSLDGKRLDNIPIEETKQYVEKVEKAHQRYKEYYEIG